MFMYNAKVLKIFSIFLIVYQNIIQKFLKTLQINFKLTFLCLKIRNMFSRTVLSRFFIFFFFFFLSLEQGYRLGLKVIVSTVLKLRIDRLKMCMLVLEALRKQFKKI